MSPADPGPPSLGNPDALHPATALGLGPTLDALVVHAEPLTQAATAAGLLVVAPS